MKKSSKLGFSLLLLIMLLCVTIFKDTYAMYVSNLTTSDSARVAKWAWVVSGDEIDEKSTTFKLNIFDSITEEDGESDEDDVVDGLIAPGTGGKFDLVIKNDSEVNATYEIEFEEENDHGINIVYSKDGKTYSTLDKLNASGELTNGGDTKTVTIYWKWAFEDSDDQDALDTELGELSAEEDVSVIVSSTLVLTQKD